MPDYFDPVGGTRGVRQNLGFEAAAVAPHGHALFVGAENALAQDGPAASTTTGSNARLLRYHLGKKKHHGPHQEWVYPTEKVVAESPIFTVNGLVELLPLGNERLLAMERSFSVGAGNTIRIFRSTCTEPPTSPASTTWTRSRSCAPCASRCCSTSTSWD